MIFSTLPGHGEATFIVALLVSTSMMSWSVWTLSPTLTRKLTIVASAIDSPSCGMMMGMDGINGVVDSNSSSLPQQTSRSGSYAPGGGTMCSPQIWVIGDG